MLLGGWSFRTKQHQERGSPPITCFLRVVPSNVVARTARLRAEAGRYNGPEYMDPLQRALDRGSKALDFINSPLVMDYVHVKFSCSLPNWTSGSLTPRTINPGFYKYRGFDEYNFRAVVSSSLPGDDQKSGASVAEEWDDLLLRLGACKRSMYTA